MSPTLKSALLTVQKKEKVTGGNVYYKVGKERRIQEHVGKEQRIQERVGKGVQNQATCW